MSEMDRMDAEGTKRMGIHIRAAGNGSENLVGILNEAFQIRSLDSQV